VSTRTGLAGEFICCAAIMRLEGDWSVVHSPMDRIDAIAFNEDIFLRIQIKTSSLKPAIAGQHKPFWHFQNGSGNKKKHLPDPSEIDIIAHVFLDHRRVAFYAAETVSQFSQRRPLHYADTPHLEQDTWDRAVQIVQERIK